MDRTAGNVAHEVRRYIRLLVALEPCLLPRQAASNVSLRLMRLPIEMLNAASACCSLGALSASQTGNLRRSSQKRYALYGGVS